MAFYQLKTKQHLPATLQEVWDFISSPANLSKITPEYMGFDILTQGAEEKMYPGMIIAYHVKPVLGIKMKWVTEITHVKELSYFVDEQRMGPYTMWHHQHKLIETTQGVMMEDIVSYQPPLGPLGALANTLLIKKQLKTIFEYRHKAVENLFGKI